MRQTLIAGLAIWAVLGGAWISPAKADALYSHCTSETENEAEYFKCQVRSQSGKTLSDVEVEVPSAEAPEFSSKSYSWVSNTSAFYFVVQTSGITGDQLWRMTQFLERSAYPVGKQAIGLATAGSNFTEEAAIGSSRLKLDNATRAMRRLVPSDNSTVILKSLEKAINKVADYDAERRAVVLLLDAGMEPSDLTESSAINQARRRNVAVYVIGFGSKDKELGSGLKRLGDKTQGGAYDMAELSTSDMQDFASKLSSKLENGQILKIKAAGLPQSSEIIVSANVDGEGRIEAAPVSVERTSEDGWMQSGKSFFTDNLLGILATIGLLLGGALLLRSTLAAMGRRATPTADDFDEDDEDYGAETRILGPESGGAGVAPRAWLELLEADGGKVPLYSGNIRVGRARDSDIRLTNSSVHRQHAMIQMNNDGEFSIHDLGTRNGVLVNGTRYSQRALTDGDVIELGEVKLRFEGVKA